MQPFLPLNAYEIYELHGPPEGEEYFCEECGCEIFEADSDICESCYKAFLEEV